MEALLWIIDHYQLFGIAGSGVILLGTLLSAMFYRGKIGERYSAFNHYISELGEVGVTPAAWIFNLSLILGGLAMVPFIFGLGLTIDTIWSLLAMLAGLWAVISMILVGFFPMNQLEPHSRVAISYFRGGLVTMLLFSLAIALQPAGQSIFPRYAAVFGAVAFIAYANFLAIATVLSRRAKAQGEKALDPQSMPERRRFMPMPFCEWLVFIAQLAWFLLIALV